MAQPDLVPDDSLRGLIRGIFDDLQTLIRDEIALARLALHQQIAGARPAVLAIGVAIGALLLGAAFLLVGVALLISYLLGLPAWVGFAVVGAFAMLTGVLMAIAARGQLANAWSMSQETIETLKENPAWIARRLSSVRR
jgi:hypothetical protein